jgi:hypothetical protein
MFKIKTICVLLIGAFILTGCYHAKITTDKNPSNNVIENQWAHSFVFGLVPPATVETAQQCPNGVSMVETKISFLNGLVSGLTFNLYTPMSIKVTCAADGMSSTSDTPETQVSKAADYETISKSLEEAAYQSLYSGGPVKFSLK